MLLAAVFTTAGVAKLADLEGSRYAAVGFGVPRRYAAALGALLPVAELLAAVLLAARPLAPGLAQAGAVCALALIALFSATIVLSLARGRAPDCHCFGQLRSAPVGPRTLVRNGGLLVLAAFVAGEGDPAWPAAAALAGLAPLGLGILFSRDARHAGPEIPEGLPLGSRAPRFELEALEGPPVSLDGLLRRAKPVLLVFTDPGCGPCIALAPDVAAWQHDHAEHVTIAVVERGGPSPPAAPDVHGRREVLLQRDGEIAELYGAEGTPSALLVDTDGRVASGVAPGRPAIEALLAQTVPGVELPAAAGRLANVPGRLGRRQLLARAAAAGAVATATITPSAWAGVLNIERKCRHERCGGRCCPKRARCGRRGGRKVCVCRDGRLTCGKHCCPKKAKCRKVGKKRVCVCRDGRRACGNRCCPESFVCGRRGRHRRRRCVCPDGHTECGGRCVRTRTDPRHCGRCGRECPTGTSCVDGDCVQGDGTGTGPGGSGACDCPPGEACCEGQCTDLNESEEHCGECGKSCPSGKTCCDGRCIDLESDPKNCGRCGRRCADNEVCSEGECRRRCRSGLRNCRGRCVDLQSDPSHCGSCGSTCSGPFDTGECCDGACCDINGSTCCPDGCKNLALDDDNCGACGNVCPPGSFCRFGTCAEPI